MTQIPLPPITICHASHVHLWNKSRTIYWVLTTPRILVGTGDWRSEENLAALKLTEEKQSEMYGFPTAAITK